MKNKLPGFIARCLWSYDIKQLDLQRNKTIIITQVLNYGDKQRINWLYSVYTEKEIKTVVCRPGRGLWFDKVLNFWEKMLDVRIPKRIREKALFKITPSFKSYSPS